MKRGLLLAAFLCFAAILPGVAHANTIALGVISFDPFLPPSPPVPGTNAYNLTNFTGGFAIDPIFPAATALSFNGAMFVLTPTSGGAITVLLGNVGPGPLLDPMGNPLFALQFPDTTTFSSAVFSATLSQTTFLLTNGTTVAVVGSPMITATILPSSGSTLVPGIDFAVLTVNVGPSTAVPEPASLLLVGSGLTFALGRVRRWRKTRVDS